MYFDGSLRISGAGAGVILISPKKERFKYVLQIHFPASHNVAEYEALVHGLRLAISLHIKCLMVYRDSMLVINQVMKDWTCQDENMAAYCQEVRRLESKFEGLELSHILRQHNEAADELANLGSRREKVPDDIFVEHLYEPTVKKKLEPSEKIEADPLPTASNLDNSDILMVEDDWRTPFLRYLLEDELPDERSEAERIQRRSHCYVVYDGELFKKGANGVLLKRVSFDEG